MKALKIPLFIIGIVVIAVGSLYLFISIPKTVDTKFSVADYNSIVKKLGIKNELNISEEDKVGLVNLFTGTFVDTNATELDNVNITDSEIAAFVNTTFKPDVISNFNIKFEDDYIALTFDVGQDIDALIDVFPAISPYRSYLEMAVGKPIYWELTLEKATEKSFVSTTKALYVGQLKLPDDEIIEGLTALGTNANKIVGDFETFRVDDLNYSSNGLYFTGSIPTEVNLK